MKYINVLSNFPPEKNKFQEKDKVFDPTESTLKQSGGNILISLKKDVSPKKLIKGIYPKKIQKYKKQYSHIKNLKLWIDSGGYDFLRSSVIDDEYIEAYLAYYLNYLENSHSEYHRIFSLDFQMATLERHDFLNTQENILKWNQRSLESSLAILLKNKKIKKKFYFVYQGKTHTLYNIWKNLYKDLNLKDHIIHRAIGGLVSAHTLSQGGTGKKLMFSPVIAPAFNALNDYVEAGNYKNKFTLHFLGVNNKIERFVILLLEKLFRRYLKNLKINKKVLFTYDTRAYASHANKRSKTGEIFSFFPKEGHIKPVRFPDPTFVSHERLSQIYADAAEFEIIKDEMENILWDDSLSSTEHYYPIFAWSNKNLDRYFKVFLSNHSIPEILFNSKNSEEISSYLSKVFADLVPSRKMLKADNRFRDFLVEEGDRSPFYEIFTKDMVKKIIVSVERIYKFHDWFCKKDRDPKLLNELMEEFINDMGIEDKLI